MKPSRREKEKADKREREKIVAEYNKGREMDRVAGVRQDAIGQKLADKESARYEARIAEREREKRQSVFDTEKMEKQHKKDVCERLNRTREKDVNCSVMACGGEAYGIGGTISSIGTFLFGNATQRMKNFLRDHGEEEITSITLGREPIQAAISAVMELISLGEFSKSKAKRSYDDFFHLYLIINGKFTLEKNQNVNYREYKPNDKEELFNVSLSGLKGKTINEFIKNGEKLMGEGPYWQNYNPLTNNCQKWIESNLKANNIDSKAATDFYFQDTQDLIDAINPSVQDALEETTSLASGVEKFISWLSGGYFGFKRGGVIGRKFGRMK